MIAFVKIQKQIYPLCQTYSPTDFQKVDQHARGKWLILYQLSYIIKDNLYLTNLHIIDLYTEINFWQGLDMKR